MARKPRAEFEITAQDKSRAQIRQAEKRLKQVAGNVRTFALAATGAIAGVTAGLSRLSTRLDAIGKAAQVTDLTTDSVQELRFAFGQLAQVTDQQVDDSLRRFNRRLGLAIDGSGPAKDTLNELGISIRDVGGNARGTEVVLEDAIERLAEVESPAIRAARASQLFGEDLGPKLAAALGQGQEAVARLRDEFRRDGGVVSAESIQAASDFKDQMSALTTIVSNQAADSIFSNAEAIEALAEALGKVVGVSTAAVGNAVTNIKFLAEEVAILVGGIADNDLERLQIKMGEASKELRRLQELASDPVASQAAGPELDRQVEAQKQLVASLTNRVARAAELRRIERDIADTQAPPESAPDPAAAGETEAQKKAREEQAESEREFQEELMASISTLREARIRERIETEQRLFEQALARRRGFKSVAQQEEFEREEQLFLARMEAEARRFEEELAQELGFKDARDRAIQEAEQAHQDAMLNARIGAAGGHEKIIKSLATFETKTAKQKGDFILGQAQALTSGLAQTSKTAFNINKAAAISEAVINTAQGVTKALASVPWPLNLAAAAATAAAGAAQIATISSTSFGGASSGLTSSGPGTGVPSMANDISPPPTVSAEERNQQTITLRVEADDSDIARTLIRGARATLDDEDDVIASSRSRQAVEIRG